MDLECALYKITNTVTGEAYWGVSGRPQRRWIYHRFQAGPRASSTWRSKLYDSMREHGRESFSFEVITWARNRAIAEGLERVAIHLGLGALNIQPGGIPGANAETLRRMQTGNIGNKHRKGIAHSPEDRERISAGLRAYWAKKRAGGSSPS